MANLKIWAQSKALNHNPLVTNVRDALGDVTEAPTIGGTSAASSAFAEGVNLVILQPEVDCYVKFGTGTPAATANHARLTAHQFYDFVVVPGQKVAVLQV